MVKTHNVKTNSTSEFMEEVVMNPDYEFVDSTFENADLTLGYFKGFTFTNCKFINCNFARSIFIRLEARNCLFENCNFRGALFESCSFTAIGGVPFEAGFVNSVFSGAELEGVHFGDLHIANTKFHGALITDLGIECCLLENPSFYGAEMRIVKILDSFGEGFSEEDFESQVTICKKVEVCTTKMLNK